jgi:hypothetical protein
MEDFERQLRNALARKEPSQSFEAKVYAAARARQSGRRFFWRWAVALAAMILISTAFLVQREREERVAGEAAKARLELALKITVTQLSKIQKTVRTSTEQE